VRATHLEEAVLVLNFIASTGSVGVMAGENQNFFLFFSTKKTA